MSTDTPDNDDRTEQVYQNERFGRTITAERTYRDRGHDPITVHVEDDEQDVSVEFRLEELADLSRGVGNVPRRPPRRELMGTIEGHYEVIDQGDLVSVGTPTAQFRVSHREYNDPPWVVAEHDADVRMVRDAAPTRDEALLALLERLGLVGDHDDTGSNDE